MKLKIITPNQSLSIDEVSFLKAQALSGEIGILPKHTDLIAPLKENSPISFQVKSETNKMTIDGGFLQVSNEESPETIIRISTKKCSHA